MYGSILGDMIGAPYEFDRSPKTKEFPLFSRGSEFTDDSVMTIAVAEALLDNTGKADDPEAAKNELLGKAVTDAKEKASVLTQAAGVTLKDIQSIYPPRIL